MKVLITGVAGFIGSRLAEGLLAHGHTVAGVDNLTTGRRENVPDGVEFYETDVRGWLPPGNDVIYHAAASYKDRDEWERDTSVNVLGTINVVREAAKTNARVIYFQTSLCYGFPDSSHPIAVDAPLAPRGSYAVSKTAGESYLRDSGLDWVSLRLANMYGPRNLSGPVPTFYQRLTEGKTCAIVDTRRDFVYVDDLIWVAVEALTKGSGAYNVASGRDTSIAELYSAVVTAMGVDGDEPEYRDRGPDDVATLLLDPSRTEADFGWTAQTPLWPGITRAIEWYREHGVTETYTHLAMKS